MDKITRYRIHLQHATLVGVALALPFLFVTTVTLDSAPLTLAALSYTAAVSTLAIAAY